MITIVSGLPRSGTSMMMQMLEAAGLEISSDGLRTADADNPRGYYELEAVKRIREDVSFLANLEGKVIKVVAPFLPSLPAEHDYQIIFMERDLDDVLDSQRRMLLRSGGEDAAAADDEALARAYRNRLQIVKDWLAMQPHVETLFVSHADVIDDPGRTAGRLARFLHLGRGVAARAETRSSLESKMARMARVVDASLCHRAAGGLGRAG